MIRYELPTQFVVETRAYEGFGEDAHGNEVEQWGPPIKQPVYGVAVPNSQEPKLAGHDRVVVDVELFVPEGLKCGPHDRVLVRGKEFEAIGYPEDFNDGPFGFRPGLVVNLRRVEG